jgi:hypothetical protein
MEGLWQRFGGRAKASPSPGSLASMTQFGLGQSFFLPVVSNENGQKMSNKRAGNDRESLILSDRIDR